MKANNNALKYKAIDIAAILYVAVEVRK